MKLTHPIPHFDQVETQQRQAQYFCRQWFIVLAIAIAMITASGCSSAKFLTEEQTLLSSVKVKSDNRQLDPSSLHGHIKQEPNSRWFTIFKVPLGIYALSGKDTTKAFNRFLRRMGEAPVIYNEQQAQISCEQLTSAMQSSGYLSAQTLLSKRQTGHKTHLTYCLSPGELYRIRSIDYDIDDPQIDSLIRRHENESKLSINMPCNANVLDEERDRIVGILHREGYYKMLKKYIYYDIDSAGGPQRLALTLHFNGKAIAEDSMYDYNRYWIGKVYVNVGGNQDFAEPCTDSIQYRGIIIRYFGKRILRPNVIYSQIDIHRGAHYDEDEVSSTYRNLGRLQILRSSNIRFEEQGNALLNCIVSLRADDINQLSAEVEGTNTAGDLGAAASVTYTNRNLFHGSEVWSTKLKGAFEAITGLEGYSDQNFFELTAESRLTFPRIIVPFLPERKRLSLHGQTEISLQYNTQDRPEFHRRYMTALWSYKWNNHRNKMQHKLDAIGVNYVFMPWISNTFRDEYLNSDNARFAIVRYSYENLFILNSAYNFIYNSSGQANSTVSGSNAYQLHFGIESAGNFLYLISKAFDLNKNSEGSYTPFNVAFAQYIKLDFDYARSFLINKNNSIAMRFASGIVLPYGNNYIVPYEKRYFAGGANSIRGWSVRELGPGSYRGEDGKVNFINQTGNIKLLFNLELRSYLFWKLSGALFIDAGNIWTTRNYTAQPGGQFKFDTFYKQIAISYGLGFRFNFDYFILRFDMGMKAVNPAYETTRGHYPLTNPNLNRDFTFHFAVGLPF